MPAKDINALIYKTALRIMGKPVILQPEGWGTVVGLRAAGQPGDGVTVRLTSGRLVEVSFGRLASMTIPDLVIPTVPVAQVVPGISTSGPAPPVPAPSPPISPAEGGKGLDAAQTKQAEDAIAVLVKLGMKSNEASEAVLLALRSGCKTQTQELITWVYRHR